MPKDIDQFVNQIAVSGLVPAAELVAWMSGLPESERPMNAEQLARELVSQKKLTKFQAEQIYAGNGKSLTLGNYLLLDKLGQGGMGLVLKAVHRRMDRIVAIKVMSQAGMKSPDAVQRFQREVKTAAKLNHPNIVAAHDADEANGTHFFVMEYVEGTDLSAFVKRHGPMPVEQAITCVIQAARGLQYAHEQGVIHRDIKPANLLLAKGSGAMNEGAGDHQDSGSTRSALLCSPPSVVVKVLDMGLARIDDGANAQSELTTTGAVMGTVDYMAPEQALSAKSADARSDIYSLGISLWYLLTGRVAYDGDSVMAKLLAHRDAAIPSLSEAFRRMPSSLSAGGNPMESGVTRTDGSSVLAPLGEKLDSVFRKMVAKQPENRYQTMAEVIHDLESCLTRPDSAEISSSGLVSNSGDTQAPASADSETLLQSTSELVALPSPDQSTTRGGLGSQSPAPASRRNKTTLVLLGVIATVVITVLSTTFLGKGTAVSQVGQADPPKELVPAAVPSQITKDTSDKPAEVVVLSESSKMPFVILRNGVAATRHETLEKAIATSQSQDVIEVHGNGPFPIGGPKPINVDKTGGVFAIKAASGFRPLFVSALSSVESLDANFDISCDSVRFEDIDFVLNGAGGFIFYNARDAAFRRCRCVTTSNTLGSLAYFHCGPGAKVSFSDCFVASAKRQGALTFSGSPARIEISNSFLIAGSTPLALHQAVGTFVELRHCTLIGSSAIAWAVPETEKQQRVPEIAKLSQCLLLGSLHISDQINWQGVENVYGDSEFGKSGVYLPNNVMLPFDEWVKRPSQPETGSKPVSTKAKGLDDLSNTDPAVMFRGVKVYLEELRTLHPEVGVDPAVADASVAKSANSEPSAANAPIGVR